MWTEWDLILSKLHFGQNFYKPNVTDFLNKTGLFKIGIFSFILSSNNFYYFQELATFTIFRIGSFGPSTQLASVYILVQTRFQCEVLLLYSIMISSISNFSLNKNWTFKENSMGLVISRSICKLSSKLHYVNLDDYFLKPIKNPI